MDQYSKWLFAVLCLATLFSLLVTPPFQSPDENEHYKRVLQLSAGAFLPVNLPGKDSGGWLDEGVERAIRPFSHLPHNPHNRVGWETFKEAYEAGAATGIKEHTRIAAISYAPWAYPGQTVGYLVSSLLSDNFLIHSYGARLGALLLALALIFWTLRIFPIERWPLLSLLLVAAPFAMFQMGSSSPDSLLVSGSLFLCAVCASLRNGTAAKAALLVAVLVVFAIGGSKAPFLVFYALICGVLPQATLPRRFKIGVACLVLALLGLSVFWFASAMPMTIDLQHAGAWQEAKRLKSEHLRDAPLLYFFLSLKKFLEMVWPYFSSLYAQMGWLEASAPKVFFIVGRVLFVVSLFGSLFPFLVRRAKSIAWSERLVDMIALGVLIVYVVGVMTALYLGFSQPGPENIGQGVQGRYFYPLLALPFFTLPALAHRQKWWKLFFWVAVVNGPVALVVTVVGRYYG